MSKKKDVYISAESSEKKKKAKRLDGMLESMNMRSDPVSTHRIATEYFQSFKIQRNIKDKDDNDSQPTAVYSTVYTAVNDAIAPVYQDKSKYTDSNKKPKVDLLHTLSEEKVYNAIKNEISRLEVDNIRIGITKLKNITKLSDKTIRVAIHNLERKKSLSIIKPSMGIYGRMYYIPPIKEVIEQRVKASIDIDKITKSIIPQ